MWMYCVTIILVATLGKLGGSMLAGWWSGMPAREAAGLGTLMNTRGLMESDNPEYRPRYKSHLPGVIFHDGVDGISDHIYD